MPTTTTVRKLTPSNVSALREVSACVTLGATFAVFDGTPEQARGALLDTAAKVPGASRSLAAVVRKLTAAAPAHVTVTEHLAAPAVERGPIGGGRLIADPVAGMLPLAGGDGFLF